MQKIITLFSFSILLLFTSCKSSYENLLASNDIEKKEAAARKYYEEGDYFKASPLFKDLIQAYSASTKVEEMFFYYAMCDYKLEDYLLSAYEFERLISKFPRGVYTEECQFLVGMAYYNESPPSNLDQSYTAKAIESFQLFLDRYPNSEKRKEANDKIDELRYRIELKAFNKAQLYHHLGDYQSAVKAYEEVLFSFPDTRHHEEINFSIVKASKQLAQASVESKKIERFKLVVKYAEDFANKYPNSDQASKATSIAKEAKKEIELLRYSIPVYYLSKKKYDLSITEFNKLLKLEKDVNVKKDLADKLIGAYYLRALEAPTEQKHNYYKSFVEKFDGLNPELKSYVLEKQKKEIELGRKNNQKYEIEAPLLLMEEGKYFLSVNAFDTLLLKSELPNRDVHILNSFIARHKLAKKVDVDKAYQLYKEVKQYAQANESAWKGSSSESKINAVLKTNEEELQKFPVKLVQVPYKEKAFKKVLSKSPNLLSSKISNNEREEIVYLQIKAAYRYAKQGKRFERLARFESALELLEKQQGLLEDATKKEKIVRLKAKIEKKIVKYQITEE